MEGGEGRLAGRCILPSGFPQGIGACGKVEQIIGELEGQSDGGAEGRQPLPVCSTSIADDRPCLAGEADQRSGLHRLELYDAGFVRAFSFRQQIQRLTSGHAPDPGSPRQFEHKLSPYCGCKLGVLVSDDVERVSEQTIAGKDRGGLVECAVHGGLAAAKIIIVHGGEIVMDQRVAVHAFERRCHPQCRHALCIEKRRTFQDEEGPQPLAPVQNPMAHRRQQVAWPQDLAIAQALIEKTAQQVFHGLRAQGQQAFKGGQGRFVHTGSDDRIPRPGQDSAGLWLPAGWAAGMPREEIQECGVEAPSVEAERRASGASRRRRRGMARRVMRRLVCVAAIIAVLPLALTLLYCIPGVHPVSTLMIADLATLRGYERQWTPLEDMGDNVVHAVMMSEDGQFCSHGGIDLGELKAALNEALSGERTRGASTIPMQTVKNLYLWPSRSFLRKAVEAPLALYLDAVMSKRRIMEIYLNIAEWGPGVYGVEAAAQHYFGRSARELSRQQAALLAVTLPNPHARNPAKPSAGLRRLAGLIESRARRAGGYVNCLG